MPYDITYDTFCSHGKCYLYNNIVVKCLSMRHIILRGQRVPTVEYALCMYIYSFIYLFIYLFIGLSGSTVQSTIVYGVNLFTMPGM